jgi:hypothetical protein
MRFEHATVGLLDFHVFADPSIHPTNHYPIVFALKRDILKCSNFIYIIPSTTPTSTYVKMARFYVL